MAVYPDHHNICPRRQCLWPPRTPFGCIDRANIVCLVLATGHCIHDAVMADFRTGHQHSPRTISLLFQLFTSHWQADRPPQVSYCPTWAGASVKIVPLALNSIFFMSSIAIFASGAGSNAEKIIQYIKGHPDIQVKLIVCNKPEAGVLHIAMRENIPTLLIERERFFEGDSYLPDIQHFEIDFIVLAGFLWKIPPALIEAYAGKIINIHPALLPKFGGKGMYGHHVHKAVIDQKERESGITIHYVDEHYDHGATIFQATCPVTPEDTPDSLAAKIHALEHAHFPRVVAETVTLHKNR